MINKLKQYRAVCHYYYYHYHQLLFLFNALFLTEMVI